MHKLVFLFSFYTWSCAHVALQPEPPARLEHVRGLPAHISSGCDIYDLTGKLLRNYPGSFCLYEDSGNTVVYYGWKLTKYDKNFNIIWQQPSLQIHHQFKKSELDNGMLSLTSKFDRKRKTTLREDVINVLDENGKITKSIEFNSVISQLKKMGFPTTPTGHAPWFEKSFTDKKKIYEFSHVNSISEFYDKGYLVHCNLQKKIILLDRNLTKIIDVIDTTGRAIHDVQKFSEDSIIFYQNFEDRPGQSRNSSLQTFDFKTRKFSQLYSGNSPDLTSSACSSLQILEEGRLLITHSNCAPAPYTVKNTTLEYADLKTGNRAHLVFDATKNINASQLIDLSLYLKNNRGL